MPLGTTKYYIRIMSTSIIARERLRITAKLARQRCVIREFKVAFPYLCNYNGKRRH